MAKDIYALLAGIVDYDETIALDNNAVAFPALNGCVNDAKKIHAVLKEIAGTGNLFVQELYNGQATKTNICRGFLDHLCQAEEGDAVLFYYSGHGTQEKADACWTTETDGLLESLACFYDEDSKDRFLLADKELRYLIARVAERKPSITIVLDCCHSGDATRNAEILPANYDRPIAKRSKGTYAFSKRQWTDFIFHDKFGPEDIKRKGVNHLLPEAPHLLLSAAESNQSAFEVAGEGIFTKHLHRLLKITRGYISNQGVYDRVALSMRYAYAQTPRLYTPPAAADFRRVSFLYGRPVAENGSAAVFYNNCQGWIVNRGELHGLFPGMEAIVLNQGDEALPSLKANVRKVMLDHALLELPKDTDRQTTWLASLNNLSRKTLNLFLSIDDATPADAGCLVDALDTLIPAILRIVDKEDDADYTLRHLNGLFYLTSPHDPYRPLSRVFVAPAFEDTPDFKGVPDFEGLAGQLRQLSGWTFLSGLSKTPPAGMNAAAPLLLEYAVGKAGYGPISGENGRYTLPLDTWQTDTWQSEEESLTATLRIRLTNNSKVELYVAVLYLDLDYAVGTELLEPAPYLLQPTEFIGLNVAGNTELSVRVDPRAYYYNWPGYTEKLKIIVSDQPFEVYALLMDPLPSPPLPASRGFRGAISTTAKRAIGNPRPFEGYSILTVDLLTTNPFHNKIKTRDLEAMLEDPATRPFAEGLYFDVGAGDVGAGAESGPFDSGNWQLRPRITVIAEDGAAEGEAEKSVVIDIANWWARRRRNIYYKEIAQRFPHRTKIVSEGDSWFQHPLVYDIIDHLSKVYAIHCVAAAADTLTNYLSGARKRGEYFLDILREDVPPIFLISGGGNDILGAQFRQFLVQDPYQKGLKGCPDGSRFLKETFGMQIDHLMDVYETIFGLLKTELPQMVTVVHGYDYPVHLDYTNKGWLGRYMIEKGIDEHGDRRTVIRYILDVFNTRLAQVAARFPNTVRYLDLRGTVLYKEGEIDQWHDEIHPNIDGFQRVGLKFIRVIEEIKAKK